jgi:hypothetical protein
MGARQDGVCKASAIFFAETVQMCIMNGEGTMNRLTHDVDWLKNPLLTGGADDGVAVSEMMQHRDAVAALWCGLERAGKNLLSDLMAMVLTKATFMVISTLGKIWTCVDYNGVHTISPIYCSA